MEVHMFRSGTPECHPMCEDLKVVSKEMRVRKSFLRFDFT